MGNVVFSFHEVPGAVWYQGEGTWYTVHVVDAGPSPAKESWPVQIIRLQAGLG